ncbi:hypothetical protein EYF80_046012 [Liparis tanakae]|uniref:Uncharacterized protein n=1 Tax=Liparis tanakae TaxID=230148 RepID=A0A4Z2FSA9_9TELE|nr:hypothetical protein EYF80_046012 [Liparis tanakae]
MTDSQVLHTGTTHSSRRPMGKRLVQGGRDLAVHLLAHTARWEAQHHEHQPVTWANSISLKGAAANDPDLL